MTDPTHLPTADEGREPATALVWIKPEVTKLDLETAQQTGIPG